MACSRYESRVWKLRCHLGIGTFYRVGLERLSLDCPRSGFSRLSYLSRLCPSIGAPADVGAASYMPMDILSQRVARSSSLMVRSFDFDTQASCSSSSSLVMHTRLLHLPAELVNSRIVLRCSQHTLAGALRARYGQTATHPRHKAAHLVSPRQTSYAHY